VGARCCRIKSRLSVAEGRPYAEGSVKGKAAVLVPLFDNEDDGISVWLTKRSSTAVTTHQGEISLPGGKAEKNETSVHTALREAFEEIGVTDCRVLGELNPVLSKHGLLVTPVVSVVPSSFKATAQTAEVDVCFRAPLSVFRENTNIHRTAIVDLFGLPTTIHFFDYVDEDGQEHCVWGLTAFILIQVAKVVFASQSQGEVTSMSNKL